MGMEEGESEREKAVRVLLCGGVAGVVTWASIFPLDVVKTRVQTQERMFAGRGEGSPLLLGRGPMGAWETAKLA